MFVGHFALGFGAKKAAPSVSLGTFFLAAQFADLLWPTLVLLGIERVAILPGATRVTPLDFVSYPYSHSLLALALWAVVFAGVYMAVRRARGRAALILAALVISHWVLDYVTHRPDMPLTLHGPVRVGLGLWQSLPGTLVVELTMFAIGVAVYVRATVAGDRIGSIGLWSLVAFLLIVYVANAFGPPPPSPAAVAGAAEAMWLLVVWAYWVDAHRRMKAQPSESGRPTAAASTT
jgi:membrane-bound metal-dependent hydrolase YbcI (DUF457 family)